MCGNNIPLKTREKEKSHCCCVAPESSELFSRGFWWIFFSPPLVESEPDLTVCKHLALSQKRLILLILHAVQAVGLKRTCFSLN